MIEALMEKRLRFVWCLVCVGLMPVFSWFGIKAGTAMGAYSGGVVMGFHLCWLIQLLGEAADARGSTQRAQTEDE